MKNAEERIGSKETVCLSCGKKMPETDECEDGRFCNIASQPSPALTHCKYCGGMGCEACNYASEQPSTARSDKDAEPMFWYDPHSTVADAPVFALTVTRGKRGKYSTPLFAGQAERAPSGESPMDFDKFFAEAKRLDLRLPPLPEKRVPDGKSLADIRQAREEVAEIYGESFDDLTANEQDLVCVGYRAALARRATAGNAAPTEADIVYAYECLQPGEQNIWCEFFSRQKPELVEEKWLRNVRQYVASNAATAAPGSSP